MIKNSYIRDIEYKYYKDHKQDNYFDDDEKIEKIKLPIHDEEDIGFFKSLYRFLFGGSYDRKEIVDELDENPIHAFDAKDLYSNERMSILSSKEKNRVGPNFGGSKKFKKLKKSKKRHTKKTKTTKVRNKKNNHIQDQI